MKRLFVALIALFLLVPQTVAARPGELVSGSPGYFQIDRNVEPFVLNGMSVWNPTQCAWDPDDHVEAVGGGYIDGGNTATISDCIIASVNPLFGISWAVHPRWHFTVSSPKPLLTKACYSTENWCMNLPQKFINKSYYYEMCVNGPFYAPTSPSVVTIPDSNGGYGVPSTVSLSITNPSNKRISSIFIQFKGGNDQDTCNTQETVMNSTDGTLWSLSYQTP